MADRARQAQRMTVDAFLAWDDGTDTRYELIDGVPVAMNPPMAAHARLMIEVGAALHKRMPKGCAVYGTGGARRPGDELSYRVPDIAVSCTPSTERWIEAPRLVVEILSPSTARVDYMVKLHFYQALASIEEILILSADRRLAQHWQRDGARWIVQEHIGGATVPLRVTTEPLPLDEIYAPLEL